MDQNYPEENKFDKIDFTKKTLARREYENCTFINCDFSNSDLSGINFTECTFSGCNISMAKLIKTTLNDIVFKDCKLTGLRFEDCQQVLFSVNFENCTLSLSSFYKQKIKKTKFKHTSLREVDFTEADLSNSVFDHCDLTGTVFENTILEKADFRTSYNYSINPELNRIKKAKFSITGIAGLLDRYDIEIE